MNEYLDIAKNGRDIRLKPHKLDPVGNAERFHQFLEFLFVIMFAKKRGSDNFETHFVPGIQECRRRFDENVLTLPRRQPPYDSNPDKRRPLF